MAVFYHLFAIVFWYGKKEDKKEEMEKYSQGHQHFSGAGYTQVKLF